MTFVKVGRLILFCGYRMFCGWIISCLWTGIPVALLVGEGGSRIASVYASAMLWVRATVGKLFTAPCKME